MPGLGPSGWPGQLQPQPSGPRIQVYNEQAHLPNCFAVVLVDEVVVIFRPVCDFSPAASFSSGPNAGPLPAWPAFAGQALGRALCFRHDLLAY